jgi:hypothetical protein
VQIAQLQAAASLEGAEERAHNTQEMRGSTHAVEAREGGEGSARDNRRGTAEKRRLATKDH